MAEQPEGAEVPKPPPVNLAAVFALRDRLMDRALAERVGTVPAGGTFAGMVEAVRRVFGPRADRWALVESMRYLAGREVSHRGAVELAWRLAGNADRVRAGRAVAPWTAQAAPEWVPVQVVAARYEIRKRPADKFGRPGHTLRFQVLAGTPCPLQLTQWWSKEKADVVAYSVGFRRKPPMFLGDHAELMGMRFQVLVDPARSGREPGFFHVACPPGLLAPNRALIKKRRRIGFDCPRGYAHECHQCPAGAATCEAACHPADYAARACPACGREWWFDTDPLFVNDNCVSCQPLVSAGIPVKRALPVVPKPGGP